MADYCSEIAEAMRAGRQLHLQCEAAPSKSPEYWQAYWACKNTTAQEDRLRKQAAGAFAELNGWRHTEKHFSIKTLIRGGVHAARGEWPGELNPHDLLDHPVYFREIPKPYRPIAIVGQPYGVGVNESRELAHSLGLELHAPPNSTASWWYPGSTQFFCLTRPGVVVRFLPDQLTFKSQHELAEVTT